MAAIEFVLNVSAFSNAAKVRHSIFKMLHRTAVVLTIDIPRFMRHYEYTSLALIYCNRQFRSLLRAR